MSDELKDALTEFACFARTLKGDEKGEAQTFLDHFFRAFGHAGAIEAGATLEFRVAKKPGSPQLELIKGQAARPKSGKKFADLLWPDRVLIEMKSRGEKLEKHYDQTFEYWTHIVPHRPPFVILCNFDEFWIYDFNTQLFDPVDRISLSELPEKISAFNFLLPVWKKPIFGNNRVEVTRKAADQMATVFREIVERGEDRQRAQRFILQLLVSMVAEDIALLPREIVTELLFECAETGASSFDLIGGLFRQMATREKARGGRFDNVDYFNGGLFEVVDPIELKRPESYRLHDSARHNDWSKVRPEIFGALFQESMDKQERHAFGAHFTSEFDIRKVVGPTIVRPWRERIDAAGKNVGELRKALADLRKFRVLDPACGSGNFLFIAYREMKRLERDVLLRLREVSKREPLESAISLHQFFGIDIIPFAVELAKVTLMLAKELELIEAQKLAETDQLLIEEKPLPLDNLDKNIICADALFMEWPKADAVIGNPPYLGAKLLKPQYGPEYINKLRSVYPAIPGMADYCVYWFRKTHDALPPSTADTPTSGRAGLVGTQNVRSNKSRAAGLDYIVKTGTILEAVDSQPWSGEANVSVSIVNWIKTRDAARLPKTRQLWSKANTRPTEKRTRGSGSSVKVYDLALREPSHINSALSDEVDVSGAAVLVSNTDPQVCFQGFIAGYEGFILTPAAAREIFRRDPKSSEVIHPFLIGRDLVTGNGTPSRFVIDLSGHDLLSAQVYQGALEHLQTHVLPEIQKKTETKTDSVAKARQQHLDRWWEMWCPRPGMLRALSKLPRYIVCSDTTKRPIFEFVAQSIWPDHKVRVFAFADDFSSGVLQSHAHWIWFVTKCSKLTERFNYTSRTVFDTFPWPQNPTRAQIKAVAEAAVALRALRRETMGKLNYSLRDLYRTLEQPGDNPLRDAHARVDAAVRAAYGMPNESDPLAFLLELNLACAAKEKAGAKITPPGLPLPLNQHAEFVTDDCIQPPQLN
jgi:SAM-dependent methyltransferase